MKNLDKHTEHMLQDEKLFLQQEWKTYTNEMNTCYKMKSYLYFYKNERPIQTYWTHATRWKACFTATIKAETS